MIQLLKCLEHSNLPDHQIKETITEDTDGIFRYLLKGDVLMDDNALLLPMLRGFLDGNPVVRVMFSQFGGLEISGRIRYISQNQNATEILKIKGVWMEKEYEDGGNPLAV
ncbi:unnamed protein product, partial [Hymenolepis diminuta]